MSDITVTAAKVGVVFPDDAEIRDMIASVAITAGQAVYETTAGKAAVADANAGSGKDRICGIALKAAGAGQAVPVLTDGFVYGFDLSGVAYAGDVFLSDTAGALATAPSTTNVVRIGRCVAMSDASLTKVLDVEILPVTQGRLIFMSTEQTGNGSEQSIAHGMGVIPNMVVCIPTDLTPSTTGAFTVSEGTHDTTSVKVTVTSGKKYKVLAIS